MDLFVIYLILIVLGALMDFLGIILSNYQATPEQLAICFITSILFLIIGIRGLIGKYKS
jgi:hypothetical protein